MIGFVALGRGGVKDGGAGAGVSETAKADQGLCADAGVLLSGAYGEYLLLQVLQFAGAIGEGAQGKLGDVRMVGEFEKIVVRFGAVELLEGKDGCHAAGEGTALSLQRVEFGRASGVGAAAQELELRVQVLLLAGADEQVEQGGIVDLGNVRERFGLKSSGTTCTQRPTFSPL